MKTIANITYPVFALFAFACFAAAGGVLGAESIDEGLNMPVQSDIENVSPELAGVETQTVLGLYNPTTHETRLWYMDNNVHVGTVAGPRVPVGWNHAYPVAAADFNGDGHIDVLFFNPITDRTWIGYMFGATQGDYGPTLPSGWQVAGTADFNRDGHPDFVLQAGTSTAIWYMNNNIHLRTVSGPTLPTPITFHSYTSLAAVADFNGNGYPDYLLRTDHPNLGTASTEIWYMHYNVRVGSPAQGPSFYPAPLPPLTWGLVGATDFDRNGRADILVFRSVIRDTAIWYMNNNLVVGSARGPNIPTGWNLFAP